MAVALDLLLSVLGIVRRLSLHTQAPLSISMTELLIEASVTCSCHPLCTTEEDAVVVLLGQCLGAHRQTIRILIHGSSEVG